MDDKCIPVKAADSCQSKADDQCVTTATAGNAESPGEIGKQPPEKEEKTSPSDETVDDDELDKEIDWIIEKTRVEIDKMEKAIRVGMEQGKK